MVTVVKELHKVTIDRDITIEVLAVEVELLKVEEEPSVLMINLNANYVANLDILSMFVITGLIFLSKGVRMSALNLLEIQEQCLL